MRSWFYLFSCNLMWALQFTCIKLVEDQVGPMFTVWGPMTLALLLLLGQALHQGVTLPALVSQPGHRRDRLQHQGWRGQDGSDHGDDSQHRERA